MTNECKTISSLSHKLRFPGCYRYNFVNQAYYSLQFFPGLYKIHLCGASGGYTTHIAEIAPGKGACVTAYTNFYNTTHLFLYVGGQGQNSTHIFGAGGYNGGADGSPDLNQSCPSAGSGGSTDLRLIKGDWNTTNGLISRIIVAAGGGSGGCYTTGGSGGDGGIITGDNGQNSSAAQGGKGATQKEAFFGYGERGVFGGTVLEKGESGGAGGSGYYGGHGGNSHGNNEGGSGGGGGSSFISGIEGFLAVDKNGQPTESPDHYSGYTFYKGNGTKGVNFGNGFAVIEAMKLFQCTIPQIFSFPNNQFFFLSLCLIALK